MIFILIPSWQNVFVFLSDISGKKYKLIIQGQKTTRISLQTPLVSRRRRGVDCSALNTCNHSAKKIIPSCYCDDLCSTFNDCCSEYTANERNVALLTRDYIEKINRTRCYPYSNGNQFDGIRVVDTCNQKYSIQNDSCEEKNGNKMTDLVFVTGNDGTIYRNEHCAMCNGVTYFEAWEIGISLEECPQGQRWKEHAHGPGINLAFHLYKIGCSVQQFPPDGYTPRYCLRPGFHEVDGTFVPVTCRDNTMPITFRMDTFGSISCCIESFPYPDDCLRDFKCYESNEKVTSKTNVLDTAFTTIFFKFKTSKVSRFNFICCIYLCPA